MNRSVIQTLDLLEGKKWDKVKKHLRKHKGKYLLGAGVAAGGFLYNKYEDNRIKKNTSKEINFTSYNF